MKKLRKQIKEYWWLEKENRNEKILTKRKRSSDRTIKNWMIG